MSVLHVPSCKTWWNVTFRQKGSNTGCPSWLTDKVFTSYFAQQCKLNHLCRNQQNQTRLISYYCTDAQWIQLVVLFSQSLNQWLNINHLVPMAEQCGNLSSENLSQGVYHKQHPPSYSTTIQVWENNQTPTKHFHTHTHTHTQLNIFPQWVEPFRVSVIHFKPVLVFINSGDFYYHQAKNDHYHVQMFSAARLIVLCPIVNVLVLFIIYGR